MDKKYTDINRYRIKKRKKMSEFAKELGLSIDIVRRTLIGISAPHDYNKIVFDEYYDEHEDEIMGVILEKETVYGGVRS